MKTLAIRQTLTATIVAAVVASTAGSAFAEQWIDPSLVPQPLAGPVQVPDWSQMQVRHCGNMLYGKSEYITNDPKEMFPEGRESHFATAKKEWVRFATENYGPAYADYANAIETGTNYGYNPAIPGYWFKVYGRPCK